MLRENSVWDTGLMGELSACMRDASICGLGQAASNPLTSLIKYFPDLFPDEKTVAAE
jgi:formate dehydrogenase